jgi:ABC-type glutathione transport system ATPase component
MRAGTAGRRLTAQMRSTPPSEAPDSPRRASHHRDASPAYASATYGSTAQAGWWAIRNYSSSGSARPSKMGITYVIGNFADAAYDPASMDLFANAVAAGVRVTQAALDGRIVVDNLTKMFPGKIRAVDRLSFTLEPGSVTGFLGPNGAGKTTTLRMVLGLVHPTAGRATVGGLPYHRLHNPTPAVGDHSYPTAPWSRQLVTGHEAQHLLQRDGWRGPAEPNHRPARHGPPPARGTERRRR